MFKTNIPSTQSLVSLNGWPVIVQTKIPFTSPCNFLISKNFKLLYMYSFKVCFDEFTSRMKIFQCTQGHFMCETCRKEMQVNTYSVDKKLNICHQFVLEMSRMSRRFHGESYWLWKIFKKIWFMKMKCEVTSSKIAKNLNMSRRGSEGGRRKSLLDPRRHVKCPVRECNYSGRTDHVKRHFCKLIVWSKTYDNTIISGNHQIWGWSKR